MIIKPTNNRLYDSRNFDSYKNYYAILLDEKKLQLVKENVNNEDVYIIRASHVVETFLLEYSNAQAVVNVNPFNIVYGHFYNDQNFFLFKKVQNGKIVGYNINKCKRKELWKNKLDQLYISNYFEDVKHTAFILNNDIHYTKKPQELQVIVYNENEEMLIFKQKWTSNYFDETVKIIVENPYEIINV